MAAAAGNSNRCQNSSQPFPAQSWPGRRSCGRVRRQRPPRHSPLARGGIHPRLPQALSAYQVKPDVLSQDQTRPSFPAKREPSWEHRSQGPCTAGRGPGLTSPLPGGEALAGPTCQQQRGRNSSQEAQGQRWSGETSLVVQRRRTQLPMPRTGVRSVVREDATCPRAAEAAHPQL